MSATRTFAVVKATAIVNGDKFGYQKADIIRQDLDLLAYIAGYLPLGGDETGVVTGAATWVPVVGRLQHSLNGDTLGGLTLEAVVSYYTTNAATSVQVRVRNVTDNSNAALGTASASTTAVDETLALTLASGVKTYRLEVLGDATNAVMAWGYLRLRKVAA